jgi:hypothetical protein
MVVPVASQFEGKNFPLDNFGNFVMGDDIGSNVIAGEPGVAAFQEISFAFETKFGGQPCNAKSAMAKPLLEMSGFASPNFVAKIANDKLVVPNQAAVRGKNHVREPWLGFNCVDINS